MKSTLINRQVYRSTSTRNIKMLNRQGKANVSFGESYNPDYLTPEEQELIVRRDKRELDYSNSQALLNTCSSIKKGERVNYDALVSHSASMSSKEKQAARKVMDDIRYSSNTGLRNASGRDFDEQTRISSLYDEKSRSNSTNNASKSTTTTSPTSNPVQREKSVKTQYEKFPDKKDKKGIIKCLLRGIPDEKIVEFEKKAGIPIKGKKSEILEENMLKQLKDATFKTLRTYVILRDYPDDFRSQIFNFLGLEIISTEELLEKLLKELGKTPKK